ncbi:hypothetical protein [Mycobacterium sp. URHB0021]|jgi:hypothetical protein
MSRLVEDDPGIWLQKSAREWQRVQVAVLGFVGLCGMLRGDSGEDHPLWLQKSGGLAAVAALVTAILAVTFIATIAQPFGTRSISLETAHRRLRIGIGITFVALGLTVISALSMWWPHEGNKLAGSSGEYLVVITNSGSNCGTLAGSAPGLLELEVAGKLLTLPLSRVVAIQSVTTC